MRPQLIPEHENECLSPAQTKMLYECMEDEKVIDPVKLDLCDYQAIEPVHPFYLLREDLDSLTEVSPYEALVINDSNKIGAMESLPTLGPQQDIMNPEEIPPMNPRTSHRTDILDNSVGKETNLQYMDRWSIFTEKLRYPAPGKTAPGYDIQGQGCMDFLPDRLNRVSQAKEVSMAPLEFQHILASEYMDRYEGITSELNVNMEYDDAVDVTTTYLGQESIRITDTFYPEQAFPIYPNCHT